MSRCRRVRPLLCRDMMVSRISASPIAGAKKSGTAEGFRPFVSSARGQERRRVFFFPARPSDYAFAGGMNHENPDQDQNHTQDPVFCRLLGRRSALFRARRRRLCDRKPGQHLLRRPRLGRHRVGDRCHAAAHAHDARGHDHVQFPRPDELQAAVRDTLSPL